MRNKLIIIGSIIIVAVALGIFVFMQTLPIPLQASTINIRPIESQISAQGSIESENQTTLHFQTPGEVTYLPYKIGDHVSAGATIAQLDTYALQDQLTAALNAYRSTRDTFDQTQQNANNNVLSNTQRGQLNFYGGGIGADQGSVDYLNNVVKRIVDQNQANLDNSVINVQLANYALQLATLTSPITGVITGEDITTPNVNVTPATAFSVADPNEPVFKAHVLESDIDYVSVGSTVSISLNGLQKTLIGSVSQIEPQKIIDPNGNYYIVDIVGSDLKQYGKLGQSGNVLIANTQSGQHLLIPAWTVLGHNYVWVLDNNHPTLKTVVTGATHGTDIEIIHGLSQMDKVITDPQALAKLKYTIL